MASTADFPAADGIAGSLDGTAAAPAAAAVTRSRIASIDVMRGLVILLMLVDHVREAFYLHKQVSDPMDVDVDRADAVLHPALPRTFARRPSCS